MVAPRELRKRLRGQLTAWLAAMATRCQAASPPLPRAVATPTPGSQAGVPGPALRVLGGGGSG